MRGYLFTHEGRAYSPNGESAPADTLDTAAHNARVAEVEVEAAKATGRAVFYLVSVTPSAAQWHIQNWLGTFDAHAYNITRSKGRGFGGGYPIVTGRFRGPDGAVWGFRNAGDSQIARCRRLKDPR